MPTLRVNQDVTLHYDDDDFTDPWRPAQAMLLQHGFSRSGRFWYNWVPLLAHEFRILRPDMRGMGQSTMAADKYEPLLDTFAEDARRIHVVAWPALEGEVGQRPGTGDAARDVLPEHHRSAWVLKVVQASAFDRCGGDRIWLPYIPPQPK